MPGRRRGGEQRRVHARVAHLRALAAAFEQVDAEFSFQAAYGRAQRWLGDVQRLGRAAGRAKPRDFGQVLELLDPHSVASDRSRSVNHVLPIDLI